jgi:Na+/citrate or Na+/malate symporter
MFAILGVTSRIIIKSKSHKYTKLQIISSYIIGAAFAVVVGLFLQDFFKENHIYAYAGAYIGGKIGEDISVYILSLFSEKEIKKTFDKIFTFLKLK